MRPTTRNVAGGAGGGASNQGDSSASGGANAGAANPGRASAGAPDGGATTAGGGTSPAGGAGAITPDGGVPNMPAGGAGALDASGGQAGSYEPNGAGGAGGDGNAVVAPVLSTIAQVRDGSNVGRVALSRVTITAVGPGRVGFWVADTATAAANSGIFVYLTNDPPVLAVGSKVDLVGSVQEFSNAGDENKLGELAVDVVDIKVSADAPVAVTPITGLSAATVASDTDGEPYEGVLVSLSNLKVTATLASGQLQLTSNTGGVIILDDVLSLTSSWPVGTCFASVTGISHVSNAVVPSIRILLHRSAFDAVTGGTCN